MRENEIKKNKFMKSDIEENKSDFFKVLGDEGEWFGHLLVSVKGYNLKSKYRISDILVMENSLVRVANVKSYIPLPSYRYKPKRKNIWDVVVKFASDKSIEKFVKGESNIIDFSVFVSGIGGFRINFSVDNEHYGMTIRVLSGSTPTLENIPYPPEYLSYFKNLMIFEKIEYFDGNELAGTEVGYIKNGGLIIHVGPTGSGKTTAMAAEINYFAEMGNGHIITYENPIEYRFGNDLKAPVRQFEIGEDVADFGEIIRHLTRNNPNMALIGEIREKYEIKAAVELASKGHLIMATMHANNAMEALTVLYTTFKETPHVLASVLKAIVAHKLFSIEGVGVVPLYEVIIAERPEIRSRLAQGSTKGGNPLQEIYMGGYVNRNLSKAVIPFDRYVEYMGRSGFLEPGNVQKVKNMLKNT